MKRRASPAGNRYARAIQMERALLIASALASVACGQPLDLGSDVLWATDHEGGLDAWSDGNGGVELSDMAGDVAVSDERARSGHYAAELSVEATGSHAYAVLRRSGDLPKEAYYSAWFLVPEQYVTRSSWTIFNLQSSDGETPNPITTGLSLNLRALPGGGYVLYVFHHDVRFLQAPIADPAPIIEPGRWFHLSVFFREASDDTGQLTAWLDGRRVYDLRHRPTGGRDHLHWSVGSVAANIPGGPARLFVDDAVVSLQRVAPEANVRAF